MKHTIYRYIVPAFLLLLSACAPVTMKQFMAEGKTALTEKQLHQLLEDHSLHLTAIDFDGQLRYQANGQLTATTLQGAKDKGKWSIDSAGQICMKFDKWYYGDQKCYTVFSDKESLVFFTANGARYYTATARSTSIADGTEDKQPSANHYNSLLPEAGVEGSTIFSDAEKKLALISLAHDCPDCNFVGVDLSGAQLAGANLAGADLSGADLESTTLRQAKLTGANLSGAKLMGSDLAGADLSGCDFSGADLSYANLIRATLTGAKFQGANLSGAHLEQTKGLKQ